MTGRFRVLVSAFLMALLLVPARAAVDPLPRSTPESVGLNSAKLAEATALLKQYVADRKIAGAVAAVARKGKLAYLEAVGVQDLESRAPMTDRSLFRIYSMTKSVTAVAVMMLHEEGRFRLDDPVAKYLPEFKDVGVATAAGVRAPARAITIEDLLLHTSGLNHRTSEEYRRAKVRSRSMTLPEFVASIVRVPLMEDPGTRYRYSESPTVLGRLVEVWSGKPFDVFLNERILGPLRMSDTTFWATPDASARLATVYAPAPGGGLTPVELEEVPFTERPKLLEGAVGLLCTAPDYLRFSQMLLNGGVLDNARILKVSTVQSITSNGLSERVQTARGGSMGWGIANVNVALTPGPATYPSNRGEYGWDGSAGTIFWVDPGLEMVTVLMTQSSPANPDSLRQRFKTLIQQSIVR
jgi:CubicO group peptidase (beta-lactamase class C family)